MTCAASPTRATRRRANWVGLSIASGFSYLINNVNFPGGVQAALRLLDTYGKTKVISNPHVAALDNQKATIKVGNRLPISQQTIVGGSTNAVTATSQYIDTGVLLQVTPHINSGGLVTLDVNAEVSNALPSGSSDPTIAPPIATRSVQTLLSVPNGHCSILSFAISQHQHERDLLHLGITNLEVDLLFPVIHGHANSSGFQLIVNLFGVLRLAVRDRQDNGLNRSQPHRERARIVLNQDAKEALHRPVQRPMAHQRLMRFPVFPDVLQTETPRQCKVELNS